VIYVSRYAVNVLKQCDKDYEQKHGLTASLNAMKQMAYKTFSNVISQKSDESVAANYISDLLATSMKAAVERQLPERIATYMLGVFAYQKYNLLTEVLEDLARNNSFADIKQYLVDDQTYVKKWLSRYTDTHIFTKTDDESEYGKTAFYLLTKFSHQIKATIGKTLDDIDRLPVRDKTSKQWVAYFYGNLPKFFGIPQQDFEFAKIKRIKDFKYFTTKLTDYLNEEEKVLKDEFFKRTEEDNVGLWHGDHTPYEKVFDKLWGCMESCPFCGETCQYSDPNHYGNGKGYPHRVMQHRPLALQGTHWLPPDINDCSYCIFANKSFRCSKKCVAKGSCKSVKRTRHDFRNYRKIFPSWEIPPSQSSECADYWIWMMWNHRNEFEKHYQRSIKLPSEWGEIDMDTAIASLARMYFSSRL
jgi:hypothetical protein